MYLQSSTQLEREGYHVERQNLLVIGICLYLHKDDGKNHRDGKKEKQQRTPRGTVQRWVHKIDGGKVEKTMRRRKNRQWRQKGLRLLPPNAAMRVYRGPE
jgi:hypothetical protein